MKVARSCSPGHEGRHPCWRNAALSAMVDGAFVAEHEQDHRLVT
jgi:hypothetical protein